MGFFLYPRKLQGCNFFQIMTGPGPVFIRFDFLEFFMKVPLKKK